MVAMNRLRIRAQVLMLSVALLLLAAGLSSWSMDLLSSETNREDFKFASRLEHLHAIGSQKRQAILHKRILGISAGSVALLPDCTQVSCIALTFDDGPNPLTTPKVLAVLEQKHVPATFFVVGSRVAGSEDLLRRMHADGDEIGNHSWSHPDLSRLTADQVKQQVQQTQDAIGRAGVPPPTLFRPPYGSVNQTVRDNVKLTFAFWNEDPKDWAANSWQQVLAASEASARPGGVVDMHDIYNVTANALGPLIDNLKGRGFNFVTMSQLMGETPPNNQFFGR